MNDLPTATEPMPAPIHHRLVGLAFRTFVTTVRLLPDWLAYGLADGFAALLVAFTWLSRRSRDRRRMGFYHNVRVAFRDRLVGAARRRLLWRWARHMTHLGVDTCKMPTITAANVEQFCDLTDMSLLRQQYERGRGVLGVSGHIGVFEYTPHLIALSDMRLVTIFRPSPIRPVSDVINEIRGAGGQGLTERKGGVRQILRTLREGHMTGVMVDVSSKRSRIHAPFLGIPAATNNTAGMLHLKTGAPIVVLTTQRTGRRRYQFRVWDIIDHIAEDDRDTAALAIAARLNSALSEAIRSHPEQWFWDSKRFRARPTDELPADDGLPPLTNPEQAFTVVTGTVANL